MMISLGHWTEAIAIFLISISEMPILYILSKLVRVGEKEAK
jgi:hypothetical protein